MGSVTTWATNKKKKMFNMLFVAIIGFAAAQVDLCLPEPVHQYVETFERHGSDVHEHGAVHTWHDATAKFILLHFSEHHHREHHSAALLDFNKKYRYHWQFVNHTVRDCVVERLDEDMRPVCIAHHANKTGNGGTIGEHDKFDFYVARVQHPGYWADIEVLVESGKPTFPIERTERGEGHGHYFHEDNRYYDVSPAAIPAEQFKVPDECPK